MKRIGKLFFDFAYVVTGFTAAHSVVALSAGKNKALYGDIVYNSSYDLTWAVLFYVFPLLVGLSVGLCLKRWNTKFVKWFCVAVCCAQVAFTSYAMFENHRYWGYCAKRPAVFTEYENISGFIGFSTISNKVQNDSDNAAGLPADPDEAAWDALRKIGFQKMPEKSRDDPNDFEVLSTVSRESEWRDFQRNEKTGSIEDSYYAFYSRPDFNIYDSRTSYVFTPGVNCDIGHTNHMPEIGRQIYDSGIIDFGSEEGYDDTGKTVGYVLEFAASGGAKYLFVGLKGGQVANDHYPCYEFLFRETPSGYELAKKRRYYVDVAGMEGFEYATVALSISLLLTMFGGLVLIVYAIVKWIGKMRGKEAIPQ